jgi:hypothetical protein
VSHEATIWAVKVRGISCTEARVLWHLADCHNPIFGCYPKQDYLADACEIDVRSIRRALDSLRAKGFINWVEQREGKNRKANRYSLGFEEGFRPLAPDEPAENQPDNLSASPAASTGQDCSLEPDKSDALNRTQESSIEPVREPVRETSNEREGASAISGPEKKSGSYADLVKRVQRFVSGEGYQEGEWPKWSASTIGHIAKQFEQLSEEDRDKACRYRDPFLAKCKRDGVRKPMPVANFFRDRVWEMLAAPTGHSASRPPEKVPAPPFGPLFGALRAWLCLPGPDDSEVPLNVRDAVIRHFEAIKRNPGIAEKYLARKGISLGADGRLVFPDGFDEDERRFRLSETGYPAVNALHEKAKIHQPAAVDARYLPLKDLCEPVPVDSPLFAEWLAHDERMGWPRLPDPGRMDVVWLPRGGPAGLSRFEAAAREILDAPEERGDEHAA